MTSETVASINETLYIRGNLGVSGRANGFQDSFHLTPDVKEWRTEGEAGINPRSISGRNLNPSESYLNSEISASWNRNSDFYVRNKSCINSMDSSVLRTCSYEINNCQDYYRPSVTKSSVKCSTDCSEVLRFLFYPVSVWDFVVRHVRRNMKISSLPYCWWHTLIAVILFILPLATCSAIDTASTSNIPTFQDFTASERRVYQASGSVWFNNLNIDNKLPQYLFVGAVDQVYRLSTADVSQGSLISTNLSQTSTPDADFSTAYQGFVKLCRIILASKNVSLDYECRNHIKIIQPINNNELYICSTGAYSPQEFYLDATTLNVKRIVNISTSANNNNGAQSGQFKCPNTPRASAVALYSNQGYSKNYNVLYSGTLVYQDNRYSVYRSSIGSTVTPDLTITPLVTNDGNTLQQNQANYVAAFDIDKFIYYFFREIAQEFLNYDTMMVSRVTRVCKNDPGGDSFTQQSFMTYSKTRLVCTDGSTASPFYYNELMDISYDSNKKIFYGLFRANNGKMGSAICVFDLAKINSQFDTGKFNVYDPSVPVYKLESDSALPSIRPSSCYYNVTVPSLTQAFVLNHLLMYGYVSPILPAPLYQSNKLAFSKMLMDNKLGYPVLYLYDDSRPQEIARMVVWSTTSKSGDDWVTGGSSHFRLLSNLKPFQSDNKPVLQMILDAGQLKSWLYAVQDSSVTQITLNVCSHYTMCTSCAADPYCGWDSGSNRCVSFNSGNSLLQGVEDPLKTCSQLCSKKLGATDRSLQVIPEVAVQLNCVSYCEPDGEVTWTLNGTSVRYTDDQGKQTNFRSLADNSLVILQANAASVGTYKCSSKDVTLAEISVSLKAGDLKGIFLTEYRNWCAEFDTYRQSYDQWVCLKNSCLDSTDGICTIDKKTIDNCQKL